MPLPPRSSGVKGDIPTLHQVSQEIPADLAELLQEARRHLPEADLVPPNLRRADQPGSLEWAVEADERACRLWWSRVRRED